MKRSLKFSNNLFHLFSCFSFLIVFAFLVVLVIHGFTNLNFLTDNGNVWASWWNWMDYNLVNTQSWLHVVLWLSMIFMIFNILITLSVLVYRQLHVKDGVSQKHQNLLAVFGLIFSVALLIMFAVIYSRIDKAANDTNSLLKMLDFIKTPPDGDKTLGPNSPITIVLVSGIVISGIAAVMAASVFFQFKKTKKVVEKT
ncbi:hypothetical protein [Williamsoniiplasma luminosum]|uniref:Uncharacterized protein n=1 Tax=Williamsoniiplasma luminosum TaxID=214888 RepID=A0A2S0NJD7_9MOLU|nr:hypothetical protein [Williamsoniiplasma luminosum]AVP49115.1 MAG: hypothetical protein C5T88_00750 [Williamsoniiplasma luminosum]